MYYRRRAHRRVGLRLLSEQGQELMAKICAVLLILLLTVSAYSYLTRKNWSVNIADVAAMRVPYNSALILESMSDIYGMSFPELLAVFAVDNRFFATQMAAKTETDIVKQYIMDYSGKKKEYGKDLSLYIDLFSRLMTEIEYFPVVDGAGNYMYGDSFGAAWLSGQKNHTGTDIIDRENRPGRLGIVSMATGIVEDCGLDADDGYFIGIRTPGGSYYYYAHLDSISATIAKGINIPAGETLGYMGSTGKSESKYGYPVRLHLGIKIKTALSRDEIWINPYVFLRIAESE